MGMPHFDCYLINDLIERRGAQTNGRRPERFPIDRHRTDFVTQIGQFSACERNALIVGRLVQRRRLRW